MLDVNGMVTIPSGLFLYGHEPAVETIQTAFAIDIFPVTCSRYEGFMAAGGYETEAFWSREGLKWIRNNSVVQPRLWEDETWHQP